MGLIPSLKPNTTKVLEVAMKATQIRQLGADRNEGGISNKDYQDIVGKLIKDISDRRFYFNSFIFISPSCKCAYVYACFFVVLFMFIINAPLPHFIDKQALSSHISTLQSKVEKLRSEIVRTIDSYIFSISLPSKLYIIWKPRFPDLCLSGPIFTGTNRESKGGRR
jgi:hypothetical protein